MRRCIALLLILALVLVCLPSCGKKEPAPEYSLNPDGTLGPFRWGMTWTAAARADQRIADEFPEARLGNAEATGKGSSFRLILSDAVFLDHRADIELFFQRFPEEGEGAPMRLSMIRAYMMLEEGEPDYIPLAAARMEAGSPAPVTAEDGSWVSGKTIRDRVSRDKLREAHPEMGEESLDYLAARPLWTVTVQSLKDPADVYGSQTAASGHRKFTYTATGYSQVLADILTGRG